MTFTFLPPYLRHMRLAIAFGLGIALTQTELRFQGIAHLAPQLPMVSKQREALASGSKAGGTLPNLQQLLNLQSAGAKVSALAVHLGSGDVLAQLNPGSALTPASVSKAILAAAALERWGSDFAFVTHFHTLGSRKGGMLQGDLILEGAGDPYLTNEKLWFLATDVARMGITQVAGDLVLNTSLFGNLTPDRNREAGKKFSTHAYDSPLSAVAVNFSVLGVVGGPGAQPGQAGIVALEPYPLSTVRLVGGVRTVSQGNPSLSVSRTRTGNRDTLRAEGALPVGALPKRVYRSVSDAEEYAGSVLLAFLEHAGVRVKGRVRVDKTPLSSDAKPLAAVEGYPLDWQIRGLMKVSNNFIGDMLTVHYARESVRLGSGPAEFTDIGARKSGVTMDKGAAKLTSYVDKAMAEYPFGDAVSEKAVIASGSGLTPENRLSAQHVVAVLARMYNNTREFPAFLASLPIPGSEGTVRDRFSSAEEAHLRERVRAKTGTLTEPVDAVSLGGYSRLRNGDWIAFAVIVNGTSAKPSFGVKNIQNAIDQDLARILPPEK